jgi:hypothetical protein
MSDRAQIRQVMDDVQAAFVAVDGRAYCSMLAPAGRLQVERFGRSFQHGDDCVETINTVAAMTRDAGAKQRPTKILSVRIHGDRAVATISNGGRPPEPMRFVKVDGQWRVPDPGFTNPFTKSAAAQ